MLKVEKKVIKLFETIGLNQGLDKLTSDIFAITFLEREPVCLNELAKKTGYSLASISNKVNFLEKIGLLTKERHPGCKKVFVCMEKDFNKVVIKQLQKKRETETKKVLKEMPKIIKEFKLEAKKDEDKDKIKFLQNYYNQSKHFDKLIEKLIIKLQNEE